MNWLLYGQYVILGIFALSVIVLASWCLGTFGVYLWFKIVVKPDREWRKKYGN